MPHERSSDESFVRIIWWRVKRDARPLIGVLADPDSEASDRMLAAFLLGGLGDRAAAEPLIARLDDEYVAVRNACVRSLGRLRARAAKPFLLAIASDPDQSESTRSKALRALSEIREPSAVPFLSPLLGSEDRQERLWAARCLARIGGETGREAVRCAGGSAGLIERARLWWIREFRWKT